MVTSKTTAMAAALIVAMAIFVTALPNTEAQSPVSAPVYAPEGVPIGTAAPGPAPDCMSALINLSDCLTFVEQGSNLTVPEKACCSELAGLVESQPICLCQLLGSGGAGSPIPIDLNKALQLPSACGVRTPPPSMCAMVGVPVSVPSGPSPSKAPGSMGIGPMGGMSPQAGEGLAPASGNPGSGASSTAISGLSTLVCLAFGSFGAFLLI